MTSSETDRTFTFPSRTEVLLTPTFSGQPYLRAPRAPCAAAILLRAPAEMLLLSQRIQSVVQIGPTSWGPAWILYHPDCKFRLSGIRRVEDGERDSSDLFQHFPVWVEPGHCSHALNSGYKEARQSSRFVLG
jgi:hypothetical protein